MKTRLGGVWGMAAATLAAGVGMGAGGCAPVNPPSTLGGSFNVRTEQGWTGRRFTDNQYVLAEEYDTDGDGRIDLWRFYSSGHLVSEERDLHGAGRVDYVAAWEGANKRLLSAARDAAGRGVFDLQVEADGPVRVDGSARWRIAEDRNRDGLADLLLWVEGPPSLFGDLGLDLATVEDLGGCIPAAYWRERRADDTGSGALGAHLRYDNGRPTYRAAVVDARGRPTRWEPLAPGADPALAAPPIAEAEYRARTAAARGRPAGGAGAASASEGTAGTGTGAVLVPAPMESAATAAPPPPGPAEAVTGPAVSADRAEASAPVPSSAVERALQRRRAGPSGGESAASVYPQRMNAVGVGF